MKKSLILFSVWCFTAFSNSGNCLALTDAIINKIGRNAYLTGHYQPSDYPEYFSVIPKEYSYQKNYLRKDVLNAFLKMAAAAEAEHIPRIIILSGLRNYEHQKDIWNTKYNKTLAHTHGKARKSFNIVLERSAIPGLSRHHWGTDIDVICLDNEHSWNETMRNQFAWLQENARRYGFFLVYTPNRIGGNGTEMWHYTYKPASRNILPMMTKLTMSDISGLNGEKNIVDFHSFLMTYMFDINPELLK